MLSEKRLKKKNTVLSLLYVESNLCRYTHIYLYIYTYLFIQLTSHKYREQIRGCQKWSIAGGRNE